MTPNFNLWLEIDNQVAISIWRANLLKTIAATGSISSAANQLGIPYRTAWQKINEMESRMNLKLVETQVGGSHGGGARLTPAGELYVAKFNQFAAEVAQAVQTAYHNHF